MWCPKKAQRGVKSAIKSWEKSRIFRYWLPLDFFGKEENTTAVWGVQSPCPWRIGFNKIT